MTYARTGEGRVVIDHTQVSDVLKGQGVGKKLVLAAVEWARASGTRITPRCSFAKATFERDPSLRDVLA
jgi:predicted GNAT family acetyltransferase